MQSGEAKTLGEALYKWRAKDFQERAEAMVGKGYLLSAQAEGRMFKGVSGYVFVSLLLDCNRTFTKIMVSWQDACRFLDELDEAESKYR